MGILTDDMKHALTEQRLIFVATVAPDGSPNLSPKGTVMVWDDDHILFTDLASPNTMRNLAANPGIEVNAVNVFSRMGYRFKGAAAIHRDGDVFDTVVGRMRNGGGTLPGLADKVRAVALIRVEQALPLVSPGYWAGSGESDMRRGYEAHLDAANAEWHAQHNAAAANASN